MTYYEAKSEPWIALDNMTGVVAAVVALADDALVAFDFLAKGVLAAGKYQAHFGWFGLCDRVQMMVFL